MEKVSLTYEELFLYPKMLLFYRAHPILAVRDLLGLHLSTHQRIDLKLMWFSVATEIIRLFGRGMSKTFLMSVYASLIWALFPRLKIMILAGGGFRQGKWVLEEIERVIKGDISGQEHTGFLYNIVDMTGRTSGSIIRKDPDMWRVPGKNGSIIATAPLGSDGEGIRGFRSHVNLIDERKSMPKSIVEKVIKPFSIIEHNVTGEDQEFINKNIYSGTLEYDEDDYTLEYYEFLKKIGEGDPRYMVSQFMYVDAFRHISVDSGEDVKYYSRYHDLHLQNWSVKYGIKVDEIEAEVDKDTTDIESWKAEHLCVPKKGTGTYYSPALIEEIMRYKIISDEEYMKMDLDIPQYLALQYRSDEPCVIGIDVARESDLTSFVVIRIGSKADTPWDKKTQTGKTNFSNLIWAWEVEYMPDYDAAMYTYQLLERYPNAQFVAMDKRGGGSNVRDQLYFVVKENIIDGTYSILYDPEDDGEGGVATLLEENGLEGNDRLRLLTFTDADNTSANRNIRSAMNNGSFYLPNTAEGLRDRGLDDDMRSGYEHTRRLAKQFTMIMTKPTANHLKFITPNPKKYKKDLYSAAIYGYDLVYKIVNKELDRDDDPEIYNGAPLVEVGRRI